MNIFTRKNDDDLLKYLTKKELQLVLPIQKILYFEDEEVIFKTNNKGRDIFLVLEGILSVFEMNKDKLEIKIDNVDEGEIIGEVNFFISPKRYFSLKAQVRTKVICYPYKKLVSIMRENPIISAKINAAINDSLADKNIKITQKL